MDIQDGLQLWVDCLEFKIIYDDIKSAKPFCAIEKDNLAVHLIQDKEFAEKDRPEIRIVTDNIEEVYASISARHPEMLHPNLKVITMRPWNALEFAIIDRSKVCIVFQQWQNR